MVKILLVSAHESIVLPGLGNNNHHGQRQRHSVHIEEFQRVVEHGGVRSAPVHDRENLVDVVLHDRARHRLFSGQHPVDIATDRVDLAVVGNHPVGMRAVPGGRRIRRESRVHDRDRRLIILVLQIVVEAAKLPDQEHALVDDRPGR